MKNKIGYTLTELPRSQSPVSGVTLIEMMVVTVIIALIAAISFPAYKIIQQREKEQRLKKILNEVRSAIYSRKSPHSLNDFTDGYRTYVKNLGIDYIYMRVNQGIAPYNTPENVVKIKQSFLKAITNGTFGYPPTPSDLYNGREISFDIPIKIHDGTSNVEIKIHIEVKRRFLRNIPPHPFSGWIPTARFEFRAATGSRVGVSDIVSRGAGLALDGSNTDNW